MSRRSSAVRLAVLLAVSAAFVSAPASAYQQYSTSRTTGNCATCHGDFRATGYVSKSDGSTWSDSLHNVHRNTMLSGDCETCHSSGSRFPVLLGSSVGGVGLSPYSCAGCHGRAEDGTGVDTQGFGAGLRQHHWSAGVTDCVSCHADANPANKTTASEDTLPPYYGNGGASHPSLPTDPCNPAPSYNESFQGTTLGLDNDGNGAYDTADAACGAVLGTPGEAGVATPLLVTAYDKITGDVTISYGAACSSSDNTIEFGLLADVSTYTYDGQVCNVGNGGTATFGLPTGSYFFVLVANDGNVEGSYGVRVDAGSATERPEDVGTLCPLPQDLSQRCD